jgi:glycosyltransferase involved in cell wall biosynthesis
MDGEAARAVLRRAGLSCPGQGFVLHVGGGQWYKHTAGVLALYAQLVRQMHATDRPLPELLVVGPTPTDAHMTLLRDLPSGASVRFVQGVEPATLQALYSTALALLFPSLAEGFGWPIAEGLACGCPVLTTGEAPMTEVGGTAAHYLPRWQATQSLAVWAAEGAQVLDALLQQPPHERAARREAGLRWAERYAPDAAIDAYLLLYEQAFRAARG